MLAEARKAARKARVKVSWIRADASVFRSKTRFDAVFCLCEGAFGFLGSADNPIEHDLDILRNINALLRTRAKMILTTPNGFEKIRKYSQGEVQRDKFDPLTMVEYFAMEWETPSGRKEVEVRERGYVPTELTLLFNQAGFRVMRIWGCTAGNWQRQPINLDEVEIVVVARKQCNLIV